MKRKYLVSNFTSQNKLMSHLQPNLVTYGTQFTLQKVPKAENLVEVQDQCDRFSTFPVLLVVKTPIHLERVV